MSAKCRDLRTLPGTKFRLPGTFNYSAPLPMKYITRAALRRASEAEEAQADVFGGFPKLAKPKEDNSQKLGQSRSSSASKQENNFSEDEGFGSPTILPTIPPILARPHHQLSQVVLSVFLSSDFMYEGLEPVVQQG